MGASRSIRVIDRGWKKRGQGPKQVNYRIPNARELVWTKNRGEGSVFEVIKRANWQSVKLFPFLAIDGEETSGTCVHAWLTKQKIIFYQNLYIYKREDGDKHVKHTQCIKCPLGIAQSVIQKMSMLSSTSVRSRVYVYIMLHLCMDNQLV